MSLDILNFIIYWDILFNKDSVKIGFKCFYFRKVNYLKINYIGGY